MKVLIFGSFDILHPGHRWLLEQAKKFGQVNVIVARDETIHRIKGRMPFNTLEVRMQNLRALGVTTFEGHQFDVLTGLREVKPDAIVLGYDQSSFVDELQKYTNTIADPPRIIRLDAFHGTQFRSRNIRRALEDERSGFMFIDKPQGEPSFRTVAQLRQITNIRQIGFAGTLDPMASGLLICGLGQATVLLDWFHLLPKRYVAELTLGSVSDTYDAEGKVIAHSSLIPSREQVEKVIGTFRGTIEQIPPMYSALKVQGTRLYEHARQGKTVERTPRSVKVHEFTDIAYEYPTLRVTVRCSSGTYVRSLAHDIGQALGCGAFLSMLRRTEIGPYTVGNAYTIASLTSATYRSQIASVEQIRSDFMSLKYLL